MQLLTDLVAGHILDQVIVVERLVRDQEVEAIDGRGQGKMV